MNSLIVYYTRTGNTKKVAELIAREINADMEEIIDKEKRSGIFGWLKSGYQATRQKLTNIEEIEKEPSSYDLVILGTPTWNKRMTPAIRTYITNYKDNFNKIAVFCTAGGRGVDNVLHTIAKLCDKEPVAMMGFIQDDVKENNLESKINEFTNNL